MYKLLDQVRQVLAGTLLIHHNFYNISFRDLECKGWKVLTYLRKILLCVIGGFIVVKLGSVSDDCRAAFTDVAHSSDVYPR